jgi:hypothetical protein
LVVAQEEKKMIIEKRYGEVTFWEFEGLLYETEEAAVAALAKVKGEDWEENPFERIVRKNKENANRLADERSGHNEKVKRSPKLKPKPRG